MAGSDAVEQCQADMIVDYVLDFQAGVWRLIFEKDPERKKFGVEKLKHERIPNLLSNCQKLLEQAPGQKHFVGGKVRIMC